MGTEDPRLIVLDGRSPRLRETLQAHLEAERMSAIFGFFLHASCIFGVPLWISAAWPGKIPVGLQHMALLTWVLWAAATLWSAVTEWRWRRRAERTIWS